MLNKSNLLQIWGRLQRYISSIFQQAETTSSTSTVECVWYTWVFLLFFWLFETGSHFAAQVAFNCLQLSCLCFPTAGITGKNYHAIVQQCPLRWKSFTLKGNSLRHRMFWGEVQQSTLQGHSSGSKQFSSFRSSWNRPNETDHPSFSKHT